VRLNLEEDNEDKLDEDEVLGQMSLVPFSFTLLINIQKIRQSIDICRDGYDIGEIRLAQISLK